MKKNVSDKNEIKHVTGKNTLGIFAFNLSFETIIKLSKKEK